MLSWAKLCAMFDLKAWRAELWTNEIFIRTTSQKKKYKSEINLVTQFSKNKIECHTRCKERKCNLIHLRRLFEPLTGINEQEPNMNEWNILSVPISNCNILNFILSNYSVETFEAIHTCHEVTNIHIYLPMCSVK